MDFGHTVMGMYWTLRASEDGYEGVTHAGVLVVARDSGAMLLVQRSMDPSDDLAVQETWEFPGGGLDDGEQPWEGAVREFTEETGMDLPPGEVVFGWRAGDEGQYQGFVYAVDAQFGIESDYFDRDEVQNIGWFTPEKAGTLELRPEVAKLDLAALAQHAVSGNEEMKMADEDTDLSGVEALVDEEPMLTMMDLMGGPIPVHGVLAPEATESGDRRGFNEGSMTKRPGRLPFSWQEASIQQHDGSVVIGSVDRLMRKDGLIHWEGLLMPSAKAGEFIDLLSFFGKFGVSVDGDKGSLDSEKTSSTGVVWFDAVRSAGLTAVAIPAFAEAYVALGPHPDMPRMDDEVLTASMVDSGDLVTFDRGPGWVTDPKETKRIHDYWTKKGQPGYAKIAWGTNGDFTRCTRLVGEKIATNSPEKARFIKQTCAQWHHDALGYWPGQANMPGNPTTEEIRRRRRGLSAAAEEIVESTEGFEVADEDAAWEAVLTSSAGRPAPPLDYFTRHPDSDALVIEDPDENGYQRTFGYLAEWGICHIGYENRCVEPPRTGSDDYPSFHLGRTRTSDGYVSTGLLTYKVEHRDAKRILTETATQNHFDNLKNAWAAVRVGEDERGIWFSGVVLPKVDTEDVVLIEASGQISGEWKYGELRAGLTVNVPGYPVERASAEFDDEGNVVALAASAFGGIKDAPCAEASDDPVGDLVIEVASRLEAKRRMDEARYAAVMEEFNEMKGEWS